MLRDIKFQIFFSSNVGWISAPFARNPPNKKGVIMQNLFFKLIIIFFSMPVIVFSAVDSSDLIKVTPNIKQNCVEYYSYHGSLYCSTKRLNTESIDPEIKNHETQIIVFDDRPWQAVWGKRTDDQTIIEYIPKGDNIDNWNELVTSDFFSGLQTKLSTAKEFADIQMANLKKMGFDPIITVIKDTKSTYLFEFRIESPTEQAQDEIQKITVGNDGVYVLHYAIKKSDMDKKNRELWVSNLSKSTIKK